MMKQIKEADNQSNFGKEISNDKEELNKNLKGLSTPMNKEIKVSHDNTETEKRKHKKSSSSYWCCNSETEKKICDIIVDKLAVDYSELSADASFVDDLGADSLDVVELIMEFEKEFGITIPDSDAERIETVGDAMAYIENACY